MRSCHHHPVAWLPLLGLLLLTPPVAIAQVVVPQPQGGLHLPNLPEQGEWLQVLTATDRWLVLQNEQGQQFPLSYDAVNLFIMRWPTTIDRITDTSLVEVNGIDAGSNRVLADHADVYHGAARNLVTPTVRRLIGFNREITLFDIERQNVFGLNWHYMLTPEEMRMPARIHIVAPPVNHVPLALSLGANNTLIVVPGPQGMSLTDITPGVRGFVRPGDLVYLVPVLEQSTPRSVVASQLVIYKQVPLDQFAR